jgi:uncharacterized membrane protein YbhN (UPF0104 family)
MLAPDQTADLMLPRVDVRSLAHRLAPVALLAGAAVAAALLAGGQVHAVADALRRLFGLSGGWIAVGAVCECVSLAGYVALLSLVAEGPTSRIGLRESAQVTLAGAAATRLLPTAGVGGAAVALWALRRAGLKALEAARTLLAFMVVVYAVFLAAIALAGGALALGLVRARGPLALSAVPAAAALLAIVLALLLALRRDAGDGAPAGDDVPRADALRRRLGAAARLLGDAVRQALGVVRSRDPRLAGAIAYWTFDAAVLWAMLHAFGAPPALPVVALAYLIGQVANTLPIPGSVSGGIAAVLIAFGVPAGLAIASVLAYRTVAVWLPTPAAIVAVPGLRSTVARWAREDAAAPVATA